MGTLTVEVSTYGKGPLSDGRAGAAVEEFTTAAAKRIARTGRDWIRVEAMAMDRSGRGGTGRAAAGVLVQDRGPGLEAIWGSMVEGQVWWPWLEGTSKRNRSTSFKGYHTFRRTRRLLSDHALDITASLADDMTRRMGGA